MPRRLLLKAGVAAGLEPAALAPDNLKEEVSDE